MAATLHVLRDQHRSCLSWLEGRFQLECDYFCAGSDCLECHPGRMDRIGRGVSRYVDRTPAIAEQNLLEAPNGSDIAHHRGMVFQSTELHRSAILRRNG